jgi:AcrR family transcriptional regulator
VPSVARTPKARGPYAKSARIQAEILDAAAEAFAERGFTSTSMREIAIAVGMTQQGLTYHFPSKHALLSAVLQRRDEVAVEHYRASGLGVMDTLRAVVQDNLSKPGLVRLMTSLASEGINPDHAAHDFVQGHFAHAREVFAALLERGQRNGEVRDDIPARELALVVVGAYEGLQLQWMIGPDVDLLTSFETVVRMLAPSSAAGKAARTRRR